MRTIPVLLCTLAIALLFQPTAWATPPDVNTLIEEAWNAWQQGDQSLVEQKFQSALQADPANMRAHIGLSFLYGLQRQYGKAWAEYDAALKGTRDRAPYLFAAWITPKFRAHYAYGSKNLDALVEEMEANGDSLGTLATMAHELLASRLLEGDDISGAGEHTHAMNCLVDWKVIGPFDNVSGSGHDKEYPPEGKFQADAKYPGKNDVPTWWFKPEAVRLDKWIDFTRYFANSNAVFYANTFVYVPTATTVSFRIGTSGSFKAFVNDELVNDTWEEYNNDLDTYIALTTLQQGWNRVLIKCGYSELGSCNFMLRITDPTGHPIPGLLSSSETHDYTSHPGANSMRLENFAESYFKQRIKQEPTHLENYLLLADCYLRNDKWVNAELILREALAIAPNSPLVLDQIVEAYQRGDKSDEIEQALDKIYAIDRSVPSALEYKFSQYMKTEDYDKAEDVLTEFERIRPGSPEWYGMRMQLYARKDMSEKVIDITNEAYRKFPRNSGFVMAEAMLMSQAARDPREALKVYRDYLEGGLDNDIMRAQADLYLSMADVGNWRRIYDKLIQLSPASPGYNIYLSKVYFNMRDYDKAEDELRRALKICPNSSTIWSRLGEIHRIQNRTAEAIKDFETALTYNPTDYEVRATLRELTGKQSVFAQFAPTNIDSVLAYAHELQPDPDDGAVVVLDRAQHVIYQKGASESVQELVVKVLNGRGIDDWKEYAIPANSYNEELIVDKAVVVKPDGTETKADVSDNYVVFKSLEDNDVIHLKWHTKNHYSGKLASQFFDTYYFNGYYPSRYVSYELIAPKDYAFSYRAQNMSSEPVKTDVPDGTLYRWTKTNIPAISYEYGMPTLDDVGSMLFLSSIDNWKYLVDWYTDVASSKTRVTYEIKDQVAKLLAENPNPTDDEKMRLVYNFITENIRYSSVEFRQGAYIPQKARDVLVNRIGDCKDVATLCIAMLREAGLKAHYVLVNTRDEGMNRNALPSVVFNHCIVAVDAGDHDKYLDLTANNYPIGSIPDGDMDAFALVIKPGQNSPINLPGGSIPRTVSSVATFRLGADNSLSGECSTRATGSAAASIRDYFRDEPRKEQEKKLLAALGGSYPNVKLNDIRFENLDNLSPGASYAYQFEVPNYLSEAGSFRILKMPWNHAEESDRALSYESREFPYDYWPSQDTLSEVITLTIPDGYTPIELPAPVRLSSPIADYTLSYTYAGGKLIATRQFVNKRKTVEPGEYKAFKAFHTSVVKEDSRLLLLQRKGGKK